MHYLSQSKGFGFVVVILEPTKNPHPKVYGWSFELNLTRLI